MFVMDEGSATATVLRELDDNRYLIQLDPPRPIPSADKSPAGVAIADQAAAIQREMDAMGIDLQEPFVAEGISSNSLARKKIRSISTIDGWLNA
jgi:hypothetical protein